MKKFFFLISIITIIISSAAYPDTHVHILAIDTEAAGDQLSWPTVSVGFCHGFYTIATDTFTLIEKKRFDIIVSIDQFEQNCLHEFWEKHPAILAELQRNALPYTEAAQRITHYITTLLSEYPDITIVSDNVSFDIPRVNTLLDFCHAPSLNKRPDGIYQMPVDLDSLGRALAGFLRTEDPIAARTIHDDLIMSALHAESCPVAHDHLPENDAYTIAWKYAHYIRSVKKQ